MKYIVLFENFDPFSHLSSTTDVIVPDHDKKSCVLGFTVKGNEKIRNPYLSLPAGYTCPNAGKCKTMAVKDPITGRVKLKDFGEFRCYAANDEVKYPNLYDRNWGNYNLILAQETKEDIVKLIDRSFKFHFSHSPRYFRIHESGDFFSQKYFDAWLEFTQKHPEIVVYGFTTSLKFWINRLNEIPNNFRLTASKGGKQDDLIEKHNLRYVDIVRNVEEAIKKRLQIDINDKLASSDSDQPFAILVHGGQPKGSAWSKDITKNRELIKQLKNRGLS